MELIVQYKSNYFLAAFHLTQTMDLEAGNSALGLYYWTMLWQLHKQINH